ncbi:LysR family transcriptional regulator [Leifsonia sp. AG29]|uniref:LysR family transcriptional regulator n=1 Tax=Leifsonia sp. AG29 TaxID=2598860 RepID=UPI0018EEF59F|nr:LysR family transcriptional regulator [Leifsonia sp. AG29]
MSKVEANASVAYSADLEALQLLALVAETGSFSMAARRRGLTQQAVSGRMAALERRLGVSLLQRSSKGTVLTPDGQVIADWAAPLLEAADQFDVAVRTLRGTRQSTLRLAASMTIAEALAPRWLSRLRRLDPEIAVGLTAINSSSVIDLVTSGSVDIGFIETPDYPVDLMQKLIATDELVVVVGKGHPWQRRRSGITPEELAAAPLVAREGGSGTRRALEEALETRGLHPAPPSLELSSTSAIRATVSSGSDAAVLSILVVKEQLGAGTLFKVPVRGMRIIRPLTAVWLSGGAENPAVERLMSIVRSE